MALPLLSCLLLVNFCLFASWVWASRPCEVNDTFGGLCNFVCELGRRWWQFTKCLGICCTPRAFRAALVKWSDRGWKRPSVRLIALYMVVRSLLLRRFGLLFFVLFNLAAIACNYLYSMGLALITYVPLGICCRWGVAVWVIWVMYRIFSWLILLWKVLQI